MGNERNVSYKFLLAMIVLLVFSLLSTLQSSKVLNDVLYFGRSNFSLWEQSASTKDSQNNKSGRKSSSFLPPKGAYKPRTTFDRETCSPDSYQPMRKVTGLFPTHANASRFFNLSYSSSLSLIPPTRQQQQQRQLKHRHLQQYPTNADNSNIPIVCEYSAERPFAQHFPHAMQQLYACYSYFQLMSEPYQNHHQTPPELILLIAPSLKRSVRRNAFLNGFVNLLEKEMGVTIMDASHYKEELLLASRINPVMSNMTAASSPEIVNVFVPKGYILSHVQQLNELLLQLSMQPTRDKNMTVETKLLLSSSSSSSLSCTSSIPRIGILNRQPSVGRSLDNVETLAQTIQQHFNLSAYTNNGRQPLLLENPHIHYFEGDVTFKEQTDFFNNVDILLSPHGAQLTGLPFMANKPCTQLLEIFPHNYLIPVFYGSLARNADIGYYYLYLSTTSPTDDEIASHATITGSSAGSRARARGVNLCPAPHVILDALTVLITSWRQCCHALSSNGTGV